MNAIPGGASGGEAAVTLSGITRRFPGVLANDRVSLTFRRGEIHALLGENGAGKSTLIAIVSGMLRPDSGRVEVAGREVRIASPSAALRLGIGTVHQHVLLVPSLTVIENLMLGAPWWRICDRRAAIRRFHALGELLSANLGPDAPVGRLSLGQQQQVEIMRALWHGEMLLILDEPTSMLTPEGVEHLGVVVRRLRDHGTAVVFITHKLKEAYGLADRISVLRRGRVAGALGPEDLRAMSEGQVIDRVVAMMFGQEEDAAGRKRTLTGSAFVRRTSEEIDRRGEPVLSLRDAHTTSRPGECPLAGAGIEVWPREVLGIAGVDGNGQKHLAEALAGQRMLSSGSTFLAGEAIPHLDVAARRRRGVRYVSDERLGEGSAARHSVATNLLLKEIGSPRLWSRGVTRWRRIHDYARRIIGDFDIRAPSGRTELASLSGGNVQKVLLAREWAPNAKLLIFNKPTHGLDFRNAGRVRDWIRSGAGASDAAIVIISNEFDELIEVSHRIAVMDRGRIAGVVDNQDGAEAKIARLMAGAEPARPPVSPPG